MQRTSLKRAAAAVVAIGLTAVGSVALAPPASAAENTEVTLASDSKPVIINSTNQAAGNLTITTTEAAVATDKIEIRVAPQGSDCDSADNAPKAISFASVPTDDQTKVDVTTVTDCVGSDLKNVVRLTFNDALPSGTVIKLTNVKYNAGATTPPGDVRLKVVTNAAPAFAAGNATVAQVDRIDGALRANTAANIAKASPNNGCSEVAVVVNGNNFPDALAAAFFGRPILLVEADSVPAATKQAIQDMGVKSVYIVGGPTVVSSAVFNDLDDDNETAGPAGCDAADGTLEVTRFGGANRYQTALAVATAPGTSVGTFDANASGTCEEKKTVIVVNGQNFPDALAAGALSSSSTARECGDGRIPLLLTEPTLLRPETIEAFGTLDNGGNVNVIIVGGEAAVSADVATAIGNLGGVDDVHRISGANRQETAIKLAEVLLDPVLGGFNDRFLVTNGLNFPDALAGGVFAGRHTGGGEGSVILLSTDTATLGTANSDFIKKYDGTPAPNMVRATILGGTTAQTPAVQTAVGNAFLARNS